MAMQNRSRDDDDLRIDAKLRLDDELRLDEELAVGDDDETRIDGIYNVDTMRRFRRRESLVRTCQRVSVPILRS